VKLKIISSIAFLFQLFLAFIGEKRLTKQVKNISKASRRHLGGISKAGKRRERRKKNYNLPRPLRGRGVPNGLSFLLQKVQISKFKLQCFCVIAI
jgi:hypothetical protein